MKHLLAVALLSLIGVTDAQKTQTVYINGQPVQAVSVSVGGKPALQILTSDLKKTGALTQGGSKPIDSIQGCKGQTLFNGVLRLTLLDASEKDGTYRVTFKVANGTNKEIGNLVSDTNLTYTALWVADDKGNAVKLSSWDDANTPNRPLLPGATATVVLSTGLNDLSQLKPTRILWRLDPSQLEPNLPWTKIRNMEFRLECK